MPIFLVVQVTVVEKPSSRHQSRKEASCLTDKAHQGVLIGHEITKQDVRVAAWQAMHRETFQAQPLKDAVATLGAVATVV